MAAVLACGCGAVLSHRSAAEHLGLRPSARLAIDVTAPHRAGRGRKGIDVHRADSLHPSDVTIVDGIPCTTVTRTLLDLAEVVDRRGVERACEQAEVLRIFDRREVEDLLARADGRRGAPVLQTILDEHREPALTRSELEEAFLAICDTAGVPRPGVNGWVPLDSGGYEPDFLWGAQRLIVEADGRATHGTRLAFENDRERDQRLLVAGWRVVRFTWRQIVYEPEKVAATLRALLGIGQPIER